MNITVEPQLQAKQNTPPVASYAMCDKTSVIRQSDGPPNSHSSRERSSDFDQIKSALQKIQNNFESSGLIFSIYSPWLSTGNRPKNVLFSVCASTGASG